MISDEKNEYSYQINGLNVFNQKWFCNGSPWIPRRSMMSKKNVPERVMLSESEMVL